MIDSIIEDGLLHYKYIYIFYLFRIQPNNSIQTVQSIEDQ